jgi:hypothetical protein
MLGIGTLAKRDDLSFLLPDTDSRETLHLKFPLMASHHAQQTFNLLSLNPIL